MGAEKGWKSRGYLPHIEACNVTQFITFRLADSLPQDVYLRLVAEHAHLPEPSRKREMYRRIEVHLDNSHGSCLLRNPVCANVILQILRESSGKLFELHALAVMPNHVHLLITPLPGYKLSAIVKSVKGRSAREINLRLGRKGRLWQPEYYDRYIRDQGHFDRVLKYIEWNPVKARLCTDPRHWPYSSASSLITQD